MVQFPERLNGRGEIYRDIVTRHVAGFGCWEPFETEIVIEILATGDREGIVLDVGAQLGYYSIIAARYGYDVLAFEYDEEVLACLTQSARMNGLADRIEARRAFVGNRTDGIQKGAC
jgi:predicted RNA methylase